MTSIAVNIREGLKKHWPFLVWLGLAVVLFWPVRGYYMALPSPDSPPFFTPGHRLRVLEKVLAGASVVSPHTLLQLTIPPLVYNDFIYLLDTLAIVVGCAWLLRGRRLDWRAAWIGGGILAFAGYSFTLVSAGHMGFFHMTVYAAFMFGALVRALEGWGWRYYILAGILAGWTIAYQPDFGFMMLLLAGAYGVWVVLRNAEDREWRARWRGLALGVPLAALMFGMTALPTVMTVKNELIEGREAQISGGSVKANPEDPGEDDPLVKWIFATNWSLYPSEVIEFVAPNIFGIDSGNRRAPYWGKLGRSLGWEEHGQGFPNFRQHTVYLGGLQLMLAAFAVGAWWRGRRERSSKVLKCGSSKVGSVEGETLTQRHGDTETRDERESQQSLVAGRKSPPLPTTDHCPLATNHWLVDVPFWTAVWVVGLLLAFGRHAPLYKLFYSLPYMSLLRAPVKFIRFVELATAILAATGVGALLTMERRKLKGWLVGAVALAALLVFAILWADSADAVMRQALEPLRLAPAAALLKRNLIGALRHGALALGVAALLFFLSGRKSGYGVTVGLVAAWLCADYYAVNHSFIQAEDLSAHYRKNSIVEKILEGGGEVPRVANYITPNVPQHWFNQSLRANGIGNSVPAPASTPQSSRFKQLFDTMQHDPVRYAKLTGASHMILPWQAARAFAGEGLEIITPFQLGSGTIEKAQNENQAAVLARVVNRQPYVWLNSEWENVAEAEYLTVFLKSVSGAAPVAIVTGEGRSHQGRAAGKGSVNVKRIQYHNGSLKTVVESDTESTQLLGMRVRYSDKLYAEVDGVEMPVLRVGQVWSGVEVAAGKHVVSMRLQRGKWFFMNLLALIFMLCTAPFCTLPAGREKGQIV